MPVMGNRPIQRVPADEAAREGASFDDLGELRRCQSAYDTGSISPVPVVDGKTYRSNSLLTRLRYSFRRGSKDRPKISVRRVGNGGIPRPADFLRKAYNSLVDRRESAFSSGSRSSARSEEVGVPLYMSLTYATDGSYLRQRNYSLPPVISVDTSPSILVFVHGGDSPNFTTERSPERFEAVEEPSLYETQTENSRRSTLRLHRNSSNRSKSTTGGAGSAPNESVLLTVPGILRSHSENTDMRLSDRDRSMTPEVRFADERRRPSRELTASLGSYSSVTSTQAQPLATDIVSGEEIISCSSPQKSPSNREQTPQTTINQQQPQQTPPQGEPKRKGSRASVHSQYFLTAAQILLVRHVWNQIFTTKGPTVIGCLIFDRLFFKYPKTKEIFGQIDLSSSRNAGRFANQDQLLKFHAKAVAIMIDNVIKHLEDMEMQSTFLEEVGARHVDLYPLGFRVQLWDQFAQALLDRTMEWGEKSKRVEDTRKAWAVIIAFLVDKLQRGFREARKGRPRSTTIPQGSSKKAWSAPILTGKTRLDMEVNLKGMATGHA